MHASELPASPDTSIPVVPVICDKCRATGMAGDAAFSAIPDILAFSPVPRRAHANGWTPQHQRAFIAALAITGSARQAARAIGRHQFGAEQLRNAKGGKDFAAAWDAAMELARERETHRIHANLAELAERRDAELASISAPGRGVGPPQAVAGASRRPSGEIHPDCDYDPDLHTDDYPEYWQAMTGIRHKLLACRRAYLMLIADDPDRRRAWEVLVGPTDWDRAGRMEPQDDEPIADPERNRFGLPNMREADMVLTVGSGLLPELTGGEDALAELRQSVLDSAESKPTDGAADAWAWSRAAARPTCPPACRNGCSCPDRPTTGGAGSIDVTDSLRDKWSAPLDFETQAMLDAIAAAKKAHPEDFD